MVQLTGPQQSATLPPRSVVRTVIGWTMLAGLAAVLAARQLTGTGYTRPPIGLPDPGGLTAIALPVVGNVRELAGIAVVGLLFLRVLIPPPVRAVHMHLIEMTVRWAWGWAGAAAASVLLTLSDMIGVPVTALPAHLDLVSIVVGTQRVMALSATLWIAMAVAFFGNRLATTSVGSTVVAALAVAALLPSSLVGHAGHHNFPLAAVIALAVHVFAAAVWVGGLLGLVTHLRGFPADLRRLVPRFSAVALVCIAAVGASGVLESAILLDGWAALWHSARGHLILAKCAAICLLAGVGYWHRRHTVGPASAGLLAPLVRLAMGEVLLMSATVGMAVVLATTA